MPQQRHRPLPAPPPGPGRPWPWPNGCGECEADYWGDDRYEKLDWYWQAAAVSKSHVTPWDLAVQHYRELHTLHVP